MHVLDKLVTVPQGTTYTSVWTTLATCRLETLAYKCTTNVAHYRLLFSSIALAVRISNSTNTSLGLHKQSVPFMFSQKYRFVLMPSYTYIITTALDMTATLTSTKQRIVNNISSGKGSLNLLACEEMWLFQQTLCNLASFVDCYTRHHFRAHILIIQLV